MVFLRRYKRTVRAPVNASNIRRLEKHPVHQFQNKIYVGYVFFTADSFMAVTYSSSLSVNYSAKIIKVKIIHEFECPTQDYRDFHLSIKRSFL